MVCAELYPLPGGQVDPARISGLKERRDQNILAEEVFILHRGAVLVIRALDEHCPQQREALRRAKRALRHDVRQQAVTQLEHVPEGIAERLRIRPRLLRRRAVAAHVRGENAHERPAVVELLRALAHEAAHIVAPVGKAACAERKPAPERAEHAHIVVLAVAAPVQGIALAARPRGASPDHALTARPHRRPIDGLIVAQRIEVVLRKAGGPRGIGAGQRRGLAEIRLDCGNAQLEQAAELFRIPFYRIRI